MMPLRRQRTNALLLCVLWFLVSALGACASRPDALVERFEEQARVAELVRSAVIGTRFTHLIYERTAPHATRPMTQYQDLVFVYLEGDGRPSTRDATRASIDPTPEHALALQLMTRTSHRAWYLTRPCYNGTHRDAACNNSLWTDARYSNAVVESMVAALTQHARSQGNPNLVLVGYSGGGALAVLMASRLQNVAGIITIAANLDTERWTDLHGYSRLLDSLNPAIDAHAFSAPEIHLVGRRDTEVPFDSTARYFAAHPQAIVWEYQDHDHRCCWTKEWPMLLDRVIQQLKLEFR
ncbi:MAG: alpha/beta hydrolase [Candidatus Obscuribacterales bacterium]|nr:alpha/beta hydrolase [Steroidobacteraceae bacterium]